MLTYVAVGALVLAYFALVAAYLALRAASRAREAAGRALRSAAGGTPADRAAAGTADGTAAGAHESAAEPAPGLSRVALVRYDAFDGMSGRLSFSLALLDEAGDGVTVSALAGHGDTRVYAKGVVGGRAPDGELHSPEESQAIDAALRSRRHRR